MVMYAKQYEMTQATNGTFNLDATESMIRFQRLHLAEATQTIIENRKQIDFFKILLTFSLECTILDSF